MGIYTRYGSRVTVVAYDKPWVTVRHFDGELRDYFLPDLWADGGAAEILAAIAATLHGAKRARRARR